jgi:hypothetical protein
MRIMSGDSAAPRTPQNRLKRIAAIRINLCRCQTIEAISMPSPAVHPENSPARKTSAAEDCTPPRRTYRNTRSYLHQGISLTPETTMKKGASGQGEGKKPTPASGKNVEES